MMSTRHTPGPWKRTDIRAVGDVIVSSATGETTERYWIGGCSIRSNDRIGSVVELSCCEKDIDQRRADADLIAAAPELLDACKLALEVCDYEHVRVLLRAVIDKAEGRS